MKAPLARLAALASAASVAAALAVSPAVAHNAGHVVLPSGECLEIGSFKESPGDLDLIPESPDPPFDEYGASFAASQGNTPILPGPCP
jgi:hypothetical protein